MKFDQKELLLLLLWFLHMGVTPQAVDSVDRLNKKCWDNAYSNPDSALFYGQMAQSIAIRNSLISEAARSGILIGIIYDVKAQYDSAMFHYHQSLKIAQATADSTLMASALSNIGLTFWHIGSDYKALENFFASLRIFESIPKSSPDVAHVINNIGLIYSEMGDFDKALGYFYEASELHQQNNDKLGLGAVLTNIAVALHQKEFSENALAIIDSSINTKTSKKDYYGLAIAYNQKAKMLIDRDELDEAYLNVMEALKFSNKIDDKSGQANAYHLLQNIFLLRQKYDVALRYGKTAMELATMINDRKLVLKIYQGLAHIFKEQGDFVNAYENYVKYAQFKDSLVNRKQLNNIYQHELQYKQEKHQDEIGLFKELQDIQSLKIEQQAWKLSNRNLQLILTATIFGIVLLLAYIGLMKLRHRHKREIVLTLMQQKTRQAENIIHAELKERKRISQELHDQLGQLLSLINMNLNNIKENHIDGVTMNNKFDETINLVEYAIREMRNISQNISPLMQKEKGLTTALKDMVQRIGNSGNISLRLDTVGLERLNDELIESLVFSLVQESLNNAIKHSECSDIQIQVVNSESEINIIVEDNGKGFDEKLAVYGQGIKLMRSKVTNFGGKVDIDSATNRGTIINIEIPTKKIFDL